MQILMYSNATGIVKRHRIFESCLCFEMMVHCQSQIHAQISKHPVTFKIIMLKNGTLHFDQNETKEMHVEFTLPK